MEITIKIEGMQCGHCSSRVKAALEKVEGVSSAEVSHETGALIEEHHIYKYEYECDDE